MPVHLKITSCPIDTILNLGYKPVLESIIKTYFYHGFSPIINLHFYFKESYNQ